MLDGYKELLFVRLRQGRPSPLSLLWHPCCCCCFCCCCFKTSEHISPDRKRDRMRSLCLSSFLLCKKIEKGKKNSNRDVFHLRHSFDALLLLLLLLFPSCFKTSEQTSKDRKRERITRKTSVPGFTKILMLVLILNWKYENYVRSKEIFLYI